MKKFTSEIVDYYNTHKRKTLPWRKKKYMTPYAIAVSEIMLQQTQVSRVIEYFETWMKEFPAVIELSKASPKVVLKLWQGLGYNNRGLRLKKLAEIIVSEYGGVFPREQSELESLPGIGPYTASAIRAFSYNEPVVMIETNIRRVFIHHFFKNQNSVNDSEIIPLIEKAMKYILKHNVISPREWYWALMDYGSQLPKTVGVNSNTQSAHYTVQSRFEGSVRQVRSGIVKWLLEHTTIQKQDIAEMLGIGNKDDTRISKAIAGLVRDELIIERKGFITLVK